MNEEFENKLKSVLNVYELITISVALELLARQMPESGLGTRWIDMAKDLSTKK